MRSTIKLVRQASAVALLAVTIAPVIRGQQSNSRSSIDRLLTKRNREFNNKALEKKLHTPAAPGEERLALAQIKEDYLRIQLVNNDLAQAAARGSALDLKAVAKLAAEIKKRAGRLKYNLVLPEPDAASDHAEANIGPGTGQLQLSLSKLSGLIVGFVNNPLFKQVNVVDVQSSVKARRDLERIITLSEQVKKSSEKLDRAAQKSR